MAVIVMKSAGAATPPPGAVDDLFAGSTLTQRKVSPCRIVHAHSDDRLLTWSYTVGLVRAFDHPEFLLTGLDPFLADSVLSRLAHQVATGHVFTEEELEKNLLHQLTCAFRRVPDSMATVLMPLAVIETDVQPIRALQCIYPDSHNRLPWRFGYNTSWHEAQPLFTSILPLTKVEMKVLRAAAGISREPVQHPLD